MEPDLKLENDSTDSTDPKSPETPMESEDGSFSPTTPSEPDSEPNEPMPLDPTKLVDRILKSHSTLQMVDKDLTAQCQRIGNLLQTYNRPESPEPTNSKNSPALIEIDPDTCGKDNTYAMQRKLWLQNLLQLKESFGHQVMFYNGKVLWQCQLGVLEEADKVPREDSLKESKIVDHTPSPMVKGISKSNSETDMVISKESRTENENSDQTPTSPEKGTQNSESDKDLGIESKTGKENAAEACPKTVPISPEKGILNSESDTCPQSVDPRDTCQEKSSPAIDVDMVPEKLSLEKENNVTPELQKTEMKISNIKSDHINCKDATASNKDKDWTRFDSVKRKLNANDSLDTIASTDTTVSKSSTEAKSCQTSNVNVGYKRKRASDFFDSDSDASDNSSNEDSSSEISHPQKNVDGVSTGIKKLRLQEHKLSAEGQVEADECNKDFQNMLSTLENKLNLNKNVNQSQVCLRKCLVCGYETKNMKRHTIFEHVTDIWWGAMGESTCWQCQQYHTYQDIRYCEGYYIHQRDYKSLSSRHTEFFNYVKDNLECDTDQELLDIIIREDLCSKSLSNFSTSELEFMRLIDRAKGLPGNHLYRAQNPVRTTELLHWRTLSAVMNYCNTRGVISGNSIATRPLRYIDTFCNVAEMYKMYNYRGVLAMFPMLWNTGTSKYLYKVVTDVTDPQVFFGPFLNLLLLDRDIKISLGLNPRLAQRCSSSYLKEIENMMYDPSVVAIGGVGLDTRFPGSLDIQISVFISFLRIAAKHQRTLRLVCNGAHHLCLSLMQQHLPPWHVVHYLNFCGSIDEANDFLEKFDNGFLGVSLQSVEPGSSAEILIHKLPLDRLVPGSNAPLTLPNRSQNALPTDVGEIIYRVAMIKRISVQTVAKQFRTNTAHLYGI